MTNWDVFHSDRLEVERELDTASVRTALVRGILTEDDLIRPTGSGKPWERIGDCLDLLELPAFLEPAADKPNLPADSATTGVANESETKQYQRFDEIDDSDDELEILTDNNTVAPEVNSRPDGSDDELEILEDISEIAVGSILPAINSSVTMPGPEELDWENPELDIELDEEEEEYDPLEEDEAVAEFTLTRGSTETVEELDLAAMVDVAFQLVLFFLVTATTVLYKSLEVPKPNADAPPDAATQGRTKSLDDLKADFILVEMDASGTVRIDRQPVPGNLTMMGLAEKLRTLRTDTGRTAMLFSAEYATPHAKAVLAYDAANEIGLAIKIAKPNGGAAASVAPPAVIKKS